MNPEIETLLFETIVKLSTIAHEDEGLPEWFRHRLHGYAIYIREDIRRVQDGHSGQSPDRIAAKYEDGESKP